MKIIQIIPAPGEWVAVFGDENPEGWTEPVVAWGLIEGKSEARYVAPLVMDINTTRIADARERDNFVRVTNTGEVGVSRLVDVWGVARGKKTQADRCACKSWDPEMCAAISVDWQSDIDTCPCGCHREALDAAKAEQGAGGG